MIWVDYCIVVVTLISVLTGIIRGFTKEVFGIVTWVAALIVAWMFGETAASLLRIKISNPALSLAVGYAATFLAGLLVGTVISTLLTETIRNSRFSSADRTLGGGFGLIRALLLVGLFILVAGTMGAKRDKWWQQSLLVGKLEWLGEGLKVIVPISWLEKLEPTPEATPAIEPESPPPHSKPRRNP